MTCATAIAMTILFAVTAGGFVTAAWRVDTWKSRYRALEMYAREMENELKRGQR